MVIKRFAVLPQRRYHTALYAAHQQRGIEARGARQQRINARVRLVDVARDEMCQGAPAQGARQHFDRGDRRTLDDQRAQRGELVQLGAKHPLVHISPAAPGIAQTHCRLFHRQVDRHACGAQYLAVRNAVFGSHALGTVRHRRDTACRKHRGQERRGRQRTAKPIVGVGDIDNFVNRRGNAVRHIVDRLQHAAHLIVRFALHAQRDQEDTRLHRVDLAFKDKAHAGARLVA